MKETLPGLHIGRRREIERVIPNLIGGLISGSITIVLAISYAALIFSGPLASYVNRGVGLILSGAFLMLILVALTSSYPGIIASPQDSAAAILALMSIGIIQDMPPESTLEETFITVVASVMTTTLLMGVIFLIIGRLKLGRLIRFIPYPVIGGFLAATGWLLVQGAFGVMVGNMPGLFHFYELFGFPTIIQWLPGFVFALILVGILRRFQNLWLLPGMIVFTLGIFYGWFFLTGQTLEKAVSLGLLLGPFDTGQLFRPLLPADLIHIRWEMILHQADKIGSILLISVVSLLLNASSIEVATRSDLDLNVELQSAGIGNLAAGLVGGPVGYHILSETLLIHKLGARGRAAPLISALLCLVVLVFGAGLIMLFPKVLLGGLLLFLGLSFLVEWVYDAFFQLNRTDYLIILAIFLVAGAVGFLQGVAVGLIIAIALFVINYSRINVVRAVLSGSSFQSAVDRPANQRRVLKEIGHQVAVFQLQGFIFFGTAYSLLTRIQARLDDKDLPTVKYMILNFTRVSGLDSSASSSFLKMAQLAENRNVHIVMVKISDDMVAHLVRGGFCTLETVHLHFFPTLDEAMEWCEDKLLATKQDELLLSKQGSTLSSELDRIFHDPEKEKRFMSYLEKIDAVLGERLIEQGDPGNALYLVDSGSAEVRLRLPDQHEIRLRTIHSGTIFGEIGFYLGEKRSASVVATTESTLYRLLDEQLQRMEAEDPELAAGLHKWLASELAERLVQNNLTLASLMD